MGLKRKRSCDVSPALSSSSYTSSCGSISPSPASRGTLVSGLGMEIDSAVPSLPTAAWNLTGGGGRILTGEVNSRTRKRFRDNRPDEVVIHENTLQKLFSAQKQHPVASPVPVQLLPAHAISHATKPSAPQKSTLHSFWSISKPAPPPAVCSHAPEFEDPERPRCEDCGKDLKAADDGMDIDMGTGGCGNPFQCWGCGKRVCDTCAVTGDERCCLHCAAMKGGRQGW